MLTCPNSMQPYILKVWDFFVCLGKKIVVVSGKTPTDIIDLCIRLSKRPQHLGKGNNISLFTQAFQKRFFRQINEKQTYQANVLANPS